VSAEGAGTGLGAAPAGGIGKEAQPARANATTTEKMVRRKGLFVGDGRIIRE